MATESPSRPLSKRVSTAIPRCSSSSSGASSRAPGSSSAHVAQLPEPGGYLTAQAGVEPVLVVRDDDGELRAFRNVCRHRGSRLLSGSGECGKAIRCRYHGWTYRFDGQLIGVPEGRAIPGLDKSAARALPRARGGASAGLVFVNLDMDATPLAEQVGGLPERLARYGLERLEPQRREADQPAGQLEDRRGQLPRGLPRADRPPGPDAPARLQELRRRAARQLGSGSSAPLRDKPSGNRMERVYQRMVEPMPGLTEEDRRVWRYIFIYPNTTIDLYPDQVGIWRIDPDGHLRTERPRAHAAAARGGPAHAAPCSTPTARSTSW